MNTLQGLLRIVSTSMHLEFGNTLSDFKNRIETRIKVNEILSEFGVTIPDGAYAGTQHIPLTYDNAMSIHLWTDKHSIGIPCNGQPKVGEYLLILSFPTGAYKLHSEYPTNTFDKMFDELMGYKPKYWDRSNKSLYFDSSKSKAVFDNYYEILAKYKEEALIEVKQKAIDKLKADIAKLEGGM